jgi:hypothetical protein
MKQGGYKPHVVATIEKWGVADGRSMRALNMELRNCLRELRRAAKAGNTGQTPQPNPVDKGDAFIGNIERELQKEYPAVIKRTLTEFHSLYMRRSILHKELKAAGELNDEKSVKERKEKLGSIDACSLRLRMDILWGFFEKYQADGSLPHESFFNRDFDLKQDETSGKGKEEETGFVLPADVEELKKMRENLRINPTCAYPELKFSK